MADFYVAVHPYANAGRPFAPAVQDQVISAGVVSGVMFVQDQDGSMRAVPVQATLYPSRATAGSAAGAGAASVTPPPGTMYAGTAAAS